MSELKIDDLDSAVARATEQAHDDGAWDEVERLAGSLDEPDRVAAAYRAVLARDLDAARAVELGKRAARFHEEWFGDDPAGLADVLTRVLELDPKSDWAFQQLTVVLTVAERWDDVLDLYDRSIAAARTKARKVKLLDEAYQVAKDLADEPERAIGYLQGKLELSPSVKQAQALERLLEKHERWSDLIALWRDQLGRQKDDAASTTLQRVAECWFDRLGDARQALDTVRELLDRLDADTDADACALLERVATAETTGGDVREDALLIARHRFEATGRPARVVALLEAVLPLGDDAQQRALHAELGQRLSDLDEHGRALEHYAALLLIDPSAVTTQRALRREAQLTGDFDRYAAALAAAAAASNDNSRTVALLVDAARTRLELCDDEGGAIELLLRALGEDDISPADVLTVGRRLEELLARADRQRERLDVLERLADAESVDSSRRAIIGDVASLAEDLGEVDRALVAWRRRLESDDGDQRALDAMIQLLLREERWAELIGSLSSRVDSGVASSQKRADLVRIANIYETYLDRKTEALDTWNRIKREFGDDPEAIASLSRLMSTLERWSDLAELLEQSSARQVDYLADQLARLGDAYRESMGDDGRALDCYRRALTVDPTHEHARRGASELLEDERTRNAAAEALVHSLRATGDLVGLLELVEARLANSDDPRQHADVLREAADIAESTAGDRERALSYVMQLFPLAPRDRVLEDRMVALARGQDRWGEVFASMGAAHQALASDPHAAAELRFREAQLRVGEAGDRDGALAAFLAVAATQPGNAAAVSAIARLATGAGREGEVAAAILAYVSERDHLPEDAIADAIAAADEVEGRGALAAAIGHALDDADVAPRHAAELWARIAAWHGDVTGDEDAAELALLASTELDKNREDTHRALAELQRRAPGMALHATVRRLVELAPGDLDLFAELAEIADAHGEPEVAEASLTALYTRASAAWKGTAPAHGEREPAELVAAAVDRLVERAIEGQRGAAALDLLVEASRLPFDEPTRRAMRNRAAHIASDVLGDDDGAIEMYRSVLAQAPDDLTALERLAALYQRHGRLPELLALRRHELEIVPEGDRRVELRLEIATLLDDIERVTARLDLLGANLEELPGHDRTIEAVSQHLERLALHGELADLLGTQAARLEELGTADRAAELWARVASLAEERLGDIERALDGHRRVANLAPTLHALDSLARLYIERGQHGAAVPWLEQAIREVDDSDRPTLALRLAKAHLAADHPHDAIAVLERELSRSDAPALELRLLLADLLRETESFQSLADVLTSALPHMRDDEAIATAAREAADIYHSRLGTPDAAVPALAKALELVPDDRSLRLMMARSQRVAGDLAAARTGLEALIADFGRRRSKERAAVHMELARVARDDGRTDDAIAELELASKMDVGNAHILKSLAELARDQGNYDQAERSLRALLLVVRRQPPGDDAEAVGLSEVLYDLHHIASVRDEEDKAQELLESVREAALASDVEALRASRTLLAYGEHDLLAEILEARIASTEATPEKAALFRQLADLREQHTDDPGAALDALLGGLELASDDKALHERARRLAARLDRVADYLAALEATVGRMRRAADAPRAAALLMRAGSIAESELDDLERARELYQRAETTADSPAEALSALSRVCGALGDVDEQTRALDELATLAMAEGPTAAQADALYQLAELQASSADLIARCLEIVARALEVEPRYSQAGAILQRAAETSDDDSDVLAVYETVARRGNDRAVLLDFLERRSRRPGATPEMVREAVEVARDLGEADRATALLDRAVDSARDGDEGLAGAVWAATALARLRAEAGEVELARDLLFEIADAGGAAELIDLGCAIAAAAADGDDPKLELAAEVYEFSRARDPRSRAIWEPLLGVYRRLGDGAKLAELCDATLPTLVDPEDRNRLRLDKARHLIDTERDAEAIDVLRDALLDDPDDLVATDLLEQVLRRDGNEEALADFLWQRFEEVRGRGVVETVVDVALRLGALLEQIGSLDVPSVYRQALEVAPESPELLAAMLAVLPDDGDPGERASTTERLLAVSDVDRAPALTLELCALRESMDDSAGVQRALEIGQRIAPTDAAIRDRLEGWYRDSGQWEPLATMMMGEASATEDDARAVARLREAATLFRDYLSDLPRAAAVFAQARERDPGSIDLASELASCQASSGDYEGAIDTVTSALEGASGDERLPGLLLRSDLFAGLGRVDEAIADLEAAHAIDRAEVEPMLLSRLERQRAAAQEDDDLDAERRATTRLIALFLGRGDDDAGRGLLLQWVERDPRDREALQKLRAMDAAAERWDGVLSACSRLVEVEEGEAQIEIAMALSEAGDKAGTPASAVPGLERVHADQPADGRVRDLLRSAYQQAGAHRELANLLLADAEHQDDDDARYETLRTAADLFVNQLGDPAAAVAPAQAAKALRPDDHATLVLLADVLVASGELDEAVSMLEPAIGEHKRRSPELASLQHRMAKVAAAQGDKDGQLGWLKKAFDVDRKDGFIASELAHLATELGDYDLALKPLRAITLMDTPGPVSRVMALLWEAKIEHARGNRAKAELWAKKALREDPNYAEAEEFLNAIAE